MDNLFGLVIFVIFAIISVVAKINEERKKTEQGRNYRKPSEEDELPEPVRRMLYGEKTIPTARPAQPRVKQDSRVKQEPSEGPARPIPVFIPRPPEQTINQQREQQQATLQRQQQVQQQQTMPVRSQQVSAAPQHVQPAQQRQRSTQQRPQGPPPIPRSGAGGTRRAPAPARGPQGLIPEVAAKQQAAQRRAPVARRSGSVLFRDLRQLRNAIIYSEVLGKPVSLREE